MDSLSASIPFRSEVRPADRDAVLRIVQSTGFLHAAEVDIAVELVDERLAKGLASGYLFLFVDEDGATVGYACYGEIPCTIGSYDLYWIAVDAAAQGKGLGRQLMAATEIAIAAAGGRAVYAETSGRPQYEPTRRFYLSCGYCEVARFRDFYDIGDDKVVYVKSVEQTGEPVSDLRPPTSDL